MDATIRDRINVLISCQFITETEADGLYAVLDVVERSEISPETNLNLAPLITHLASALRRHRTGERVEAPAQLLVEDMKAHGVFEEAELLANEIADVFPGKLDESERLYIIGHVGALLLQR